MTNKNDNYIRLRLPSELKKKFQDECWKHRTDMGKAIREFIRKYIK